MRTKTVDYTGHGYDLHLVVSEATVLIGIKRALLRERAKTTFDEVRGSVAESARGILELLYYPDLVASTVEATGTTASGAEFELDSLTANIFTALPEDLFWAWHNVVYDLNPQWSPSAEKTPEEQADEKKGAASSESAPVTG